MAFNFIKCPLIGERDHRIKKVLERGDWDFAYLSHAELCPDPAAPSATGPEDRYP